MPIIVTAKDMGMYRYYLREETLMIGGSGKSGEKNSTATRPGKKTHLNNPEEKKLNPTTWKKKKVHRLVAEEKKIISRLARKKKPQNR